MVWRVSRYVEQSACSCVAFVPQKTGGCLPRQRHTTQSSIRYVLYSLERVGPTPYVLFVSPAIERRLVCIFLQITAALRTAADLIDSNTQTANLLIGVFSAPDIFLDANERIEVLVNLFSSGVATCPETKGCVAAVAGGLSALALQLGSSRTRAWLEQLRDSDIQQMCLTEFLDAFTLGAH